MLKILIINLVLSISFIESAVVCDDLCLKKNYPDLLESMMDFSDKNSINVKVLNSNNILSQGDTMYCKVLDSNTMIDSKQDSLIVYTNASLQPTYTFFEASHFNGCFTFQIKANKKAWISLSTGSSNTDAMYEIVLNKEDKNIISGIRVRIVSQKIEKFLVTSNLGRINEKEFKTVWVKWDKQQIEVGLQNNTKGFLKYKAPTTLLPITKIGILTWENLGTWVISGDQKCPGYNSNSALTISETKCWKIPLHLQETPLIKALIKNQYELLDNLKKISEKLENKLSNEVIKLNYDDAQSFMDHARINDRSVKLNGNPNGNEYKKYNEDKIFEKIESEFLKCTTQLGSKIIDENENLKIISLFELSLKKLQHKINEFEKTLPSPKQEDINDLKTHQIILSTMMKELPVANDTTSLIPKLNTINQEIQSLLQNINIETPDENIPIIESFKLRLKDLNQKIEDLNENKNPQIEDIRLLENNQEILKSLLSDLNKLNVENLPDLNSELDATNVKIYDAIVTTLIPKMRFELKSLESDVNNAKQNKFLTFKNILDLHIKKKLIQNKFLEWDSNIQDSAKLWPKSKLLDLNMEITDLSQQIDNLSPKDDASSIKNDISSIKNDVSSSSKDVSNPIIVLLKLYKEKLDQEIVNFKLIQSPVIVDKLKLQKKQELIQLLLNDYIDTYDADLTDKNLFTEINNSINEVNALIKEKSPVNEISNLLNRVITFLAEDIKTKTNKLEKNKNIISQNEIRGSSIDINHNIDNINYLKNALNLVSEKIPELTLPNTYEADYNINKCVKTIKLVINNKETTGYSPISSEQRVIFDPMENVLKNYLNNLKKINDDFIGIRNPSPQTGNTVLNKVHLIKSNVETLVHQMNDIVKKNPGFIIPPQIKINFDNIERFESEIMDKVNDISVDSESTPIMDLLNIQKDKLEILKKIALDIKEPSAADIELLQMKFGILEKVANELIEASKDESLNNKNLADTKNSIKILSADLHGKIDNFLDKGHENAEKLIKSQLELIYTIKNNFEDFNQLRKFNKKHLQRQLEYLEKFTDQIQYYDSKIKAFSSIDNEEIKNLLDSYNKNKRYLYSINLINDFRKKILEKYNSLTILDDYQEIITPDSLNYQYFKIVNRTVRQIEFRVLAEHNANIALVSGLKKNDFAIELFIGDQFNEKSIIRRNHLKNIAENSTINVLDSLTVRGFWLSWADETIQLGRKDELEPFLKYESDYGMPQLESIKFLGLGTTHGVTGKWYFKKDFILQKADGTSKNIKSSEEDFFDRAEPRIGEGVVIN